MSLCAGKLCRASHVDRWIFVPPSNGLLLMRWVAWKPQGIVWQHVIARRRHGLDCLYMFWFLAAALPYHVHRSVVRSALADFMRLNGLSPPVPACVLVDDESEAQMTRGWFRQVIGNMALIRPAWAKAISANIYVNIRPVVSIQRRCVNVSSQMKRFTFDQLSTLNLKDFQHIHEGRDLIRLPCNGRLPWRGIEDVSSQVSLGQQCSRWLQRQRIPDIFAQPMFRALSRLQKTDCRTRSAATPGPALSTRRPLTTGASSSAAGPSCARAALSFRRGSSSSGSSSG